MHNACSVSQTMVGRNLLLRDLMCSSYVDKGCWPLVYTKNSPRIFSSPSWRCQVLNLDTIYNILQYDTCRSMNSNVMAISMLFSIHCEEIPALRIQLDTLKCFGGFKIAISAIQIKNSFSLSIASGSSLWQCLFSVHI